MELNDTDERKNDFCPDLIATAKFPRRVLPQIYKSSRIFSSINPHKFFKITKLTLKQFLRKMAEKTTMAKPLSSDKSCQLATFGAGCFWGVEKSFRRKFVGNGALDVQVGYAGGHQENVNYRQVCSGSTGHAEVVQIKYVSRAYLFSLSSTDNILFLMFRTLPIFPMTLW